MTATLRAECVLGRKRVKKRDVRWFFRARRRACARRGQRLCSFLQVVWSGVGNPPAAISIVRCGYAQRTFAQRLRLTRFAPPTVVGRTFFGLALRVSEPAAPPKIFIFVLLREINAIVGCGR